MKKGWTNCLIRPFFLLESMNLKLLRLITIFIFLSIYYLEYPDTDTKLYKKRMVKRLVITLFGNHTMEKRIRNINEGVLG